MRESRSHSEDGVEKWTAVGDSFAHFCTQEQVGQQDASNVRQREQWKGSEGKHGNSTPKEDESF